MSARFHALSFVLCASALLFSPLSRADQPASTNDPIYTLVTPTNTNPLAPPILSSTPTTPTLTTPKDASSKKIADAIEKMNKKDVDGALNDLTEALKLNPNSTGAYVLRASIYTQRKQWPQAEADFDAAAKIAPTNVVLKFNLAEIKFQQKQYDVARLGFAALMKDPDMGDFASFKVFLCDLFGGHEDDAKKELDAFNDAMGNPSYYFSNAAWSLFHKNIEDARSWLLSASRIYPPQKNAYYSSSLRDLGYLPIPGPDDKVTPPLAATNTPPPATNTPPLTPVLPPPETTNPPNP